MQKASILVMVLTSIWSMRLAAQSPTGPVGSVQGVWRVTEVTTTGPTARNIKDHRPGLFFITAKHFALVVEAGDKPRPSEPPMTFEALRDVSGPFVAFAGTYEASTNELTVRIAVHKTPANMLPGSFMTWSYRVDGDTMTLLTVRTHEGPSKAPITWKLTRVE